MKLFSTIILALAALCAGTAARAAETHNFANYNIRYVNPSNGDTGDKHWSNRGPYVVQVVKDYDFDIVGMEEVTGLDKGHSVNPATGRSQLEDLKAWLPDYNILAWERSGQNNAKDYSYNAIAYKKARYECLESGCFWLSPTPDKAGPGWDTNQEYAKLWRTCGWTKMKVKATGEIFIFAVTHVNYGPSLDGRNSGRVISERLNAIAGDYPVVLVGDFNMRRADHPEAYRNYAANFYDAALTADENYCLPRSNPQTTVTGQNWYTVDDSRMSGSEFDFCFYRNMHVLSRHIITENYGRSVNPSDHFPLLIRCELQPARAAATVHVDGSAEAGGDGTAARPYNTIARGVAAAGLLGTVRVAEGTYAESIEPETTVSIEGGYDRAFTAVTGRSTIDATSLSAPALSVPAWYSLSVANMEIRGYASTAEATDGAIRFGGTDLTLDNCLLSGNSASGAGAGVCVRSAAALLVRDCVFEGNTARNGAGIYVADAADMLVRNSSFVANTGKNTGALSLDKCPSATRLTVVNSTFASNRLEAPSGLAAVTRRWGGAAIYSNLTVDERINLAHLTVTGNTATFAGSNKANFNGAAINFFGLGLVHIHNSIIAGNYSDGAVHDLWMEDTALPEKVMYNIYTCPSSVSIKPGTGDLATGDYESGLACVASLLDGEVAGGRFVPRISRDGTPAVVPVSTSWGATPVNYLSSYQRLLEGQFGQDIDGDGSIGGTLSIDQRYRPRADKTIPGAIEYSAGDGIDDLRGPGQAEGAPRGTAPGRYSLAADTDARLYSLDGRLLDTLRPADGTIDIDLNAQAAGVYILVCANQSYKITK